MVVVVLSHSNTLFLFRFPVKMQGADTPAAKGSTQGDAAAVSQAVRGLNEDWDKYDCGIREKDFDSLKCQNVLEAMRRCGMDASKATRPTKVDLFPPVLVKTPPVLIQLADYNQTTSCQFMASMLGACAAGGAVFAASQLGPESGKDAPWMPALAAAGAGAGVSALGGLICTSSAPKQAYGNHEEEPFVLEGTYTQRVSTEASAQRLIDELTAEHAKHDAP